MPSIIALLRGVNVGGHNKIKMDALRALFDSLGFRDTQTYVQSGNVVFKTDKRSMPALSAQIEAAIEASFGFRPDVILRTAGELREIAARNPFPAQAAADPSHLAVFFLSAAPTPEARARVLALKPHPEQLHLIDREIYIYFPAGFGDSKLPALLDRALKSSATARNWNTVARLLSLAGAA